MSCNCNQPTKVGAWNPVPEFTKPTEIMPGENIDCYMKRAQDGVKNSAAEKIQNRIDNTALVSDLNLVVNDTFRLTPGSTRTASLWTATIDGSSLFSILPDLNLNPSTGAISGTIAESRANKNYKILVTASDSAGVIDSREFNFFPKAAAKDDTIKFVFPYTPNGRITCNYGPRKPPASGASSDHKGIDISQPGSELGYILAAADGQVVKAGPASGFGNWIVIEHNDAQGRLVATTVYGHMNEIFVKVGQKVSAGQKIAKEGNAGIGSAAHLHFELHKGKWRNPVDPVPYLNGTFQVAGNNLPGKYGEPDPSTFEPVTNQNTGMTTGEANSGNNCPDTLPNQPGSPGQPPLPPEPPNVPVVPASSDVQAQIQQALDEDPDLSDEDKKILMFMAKIESTFNPRAKNPQSSARGLYQMLDKTAVKYYGIIGIPATEENRFNPYYATKAQIQFYKREQVRYYNEFKNSGNTKMAGKTLSADAASRLAGLNKGEFVYGICHHDGVGSGVCGKDLGGVAYWRKRIRET